MMQTDKIYVYDSSMVFPYALLLFGGDISVEHDKQLISVDDWIKFKAPGRIAVLVKELRKFLDRLLQDKIHDPSLYVSSSPVLTAIVQLITSNGF